ncbi:MAG: hypothetical protein NVS3B5_02140 [Sphingomicrobium sp.]
MVRMGNVIAFRRKRFTGFLPDDIGNAEAKAREESLKSTAGMADLVAFAKFGEPPLDLPPDCA